MCRCDDGGGVEVELIVKPDPDGGFVVTCPQLPELMATGATHEQALANAQDALGTVLDLYEELGKPIPHPSHNN